MILSTRNVRGLNHPLKQKEVKLFLKKHKIDIVGCLETRVKEQKAAAILRKVGNGWNNCCNYPVASNGRIWMLWKTHVNVSIIQVKEQYIHSYISDVGGTFAAYVTIIYAKNSIQERQELWRGLRDLGNTIHEAWLMLGDFNVVLSSEDRIESAVTQQEVQDFKDCVDHLQLTSLQAKGCYYTFCNKQQQDHRVYSKIDWALGNYYWLQNYGFVEAEFLPPGISDHSPIIIHHAA